MCRSGWSISLYQSRSLATATSFRPCSGNFDTGEAATLGAMVYDTRASFPLMTTTDTPPQRRSFQITPSASSENLLASCHHSHSSSSHIPTTSTQARTAVDQLLQRCALTNHGGVDFTPAEDGCGGVYFVTGTDGQKMSVFKPTDEEVNCENNPKGYVNVDTNSPRHFGAPREVAAYQLDQHYGGFSGVPVTALVSVSNKKGQSKWGSLQEFVYHEDSCENFGSSVIPTDEVHKIGILDIRLVNQDRHFANILCRYDDAGKLRLTPIDHGAVLPSCFKLDKARFEWMYWKQAKQPFSETTLAHIASLDTKEDADFLRSMEVEEECVVTMVLSTKLLQLGAKHGLSLWDIGNLIQRDLFEEDRPSHLEQAIFDLLGPSPTKEDILSAVDDVSAKAVSHAAVDYLTRKHQNVC